MPCREREVPNSLTSSPSSPFDTVEFAHLTLSSRTGKPQPRIFTAQEIDRLLEREGLAKAKDAEDDPAAAANAAASTDPVAAQAAGSVSGSTGAPAGAGSGTGQGSEAGGGGDGMHVD